MTHDVNTDNNDSHEVIYDAVTNDDNDDQVIAAEGEKTASVALRAASDNIAGNHAAMQLR